MTSDMDDVSSPYGNGLVCDTNCLSHNVAQAVTLCRRELSLYTRHISSNSCRELTVTLYDTGADGEKKITYRRRRLLHMYAITSSQVLPMPKMREVKSMVCP